MIEINANGPASGNPILGLNEHKLVECRNVTFSSDAAKSLK
jgi:hypothetical protein